MKVSLWACRLRNDTSEGRLCPGSRYVEVGVDPGPCGHVTLRSSLGEVTERVCDMPMDQIGDFEMELT